MNYSNEKVAVLYGSQTGNAQEVAERIWRDSKRFYFETAIKPLDDYNALDLINEQCVIFVCSTTGQGEEPDNMKLFWKFMLKKSLGATIFSNLRFVIYAIVYISVAFYIYFICIDFQNVLHISQIENVPHLT